MEINKALTSTRLLDLLLREGELEGFSNRYQIELNSFETEEVTIGYLLKDQTDDDMRELRLWSDDMAVEAFMTEFRIESLEDLEKITLNDLWALYRANRAHMTLFDGVEDVEFRIGDGVGTTEEALER